ncbi:PadR family transcriptional regulator [Psychrobacillus antarcticus]|uniref:PadR family transcriptional regulator n=1 Tax=Psychrobacillus antarcticus TaxID=2879115 RepID=UPI00240869B8|nr:PadR family transcriptional regulator [Psychrobacillus antarcticus]
MSIQIYILSKLIEGNNYPYKLKKELSEPFPFDKIGNLTISKIYYHFESLSKQGFIEPVEVIKEENRPDKQLFAITEKGRENLPQKIYSLFEKSNTVIDLIAGLFFLRFVDKSRIVRILESKLDDMTRKLDKLKLVYEQIKVDDERALMIEITNDFLMDKFNSEVVAIQRIVEKLKEEIK